MTKQELLNEAKQKFKVVKDPINVDPNVSDSELTARCYDLPVFEVSEGGSTRKKVPFYVLNEGTSNEEAFWGQPEPDRTFQQEVKTLIQNKEDDGTILKGEIKELNENKRFSIIRAFIPNNETVLEKTYFAYDDGSGLQFMQM